MKEPVAVHPVRVPSFNFNLYLRNQSVPSLKSIDLTVHDVSAAVEFFREVVGLAVLYEIDRFAEIDAGCTRIFLSPDALVPVASARGVILHFEETDLAAAHARARAFGSPILQGPLQTDWGTQSLLVRGPEQIVIDFYNSSVPHPDDSSLVP